MAARLSQKAIELGCQAKRHWNSGVSAVTPEHLEQRIALVLAEADDARGEVAVDVERLAAGDGMGAHDGMLVAREAALLGRVAEAAAIDLRAVMHRAQALAQALDRRRERIVGAVHVGEQGVAAAVGRQLLHVEDAAHRRFGIATDVGVPFLAGDVLGILVGLDDQDLGMLPVARVEVGCRCSSPKRRPNALCCSWLSSWSRKKITRLAISASWISWKVWLPSGLARSTPKISAPMHGRELAHLDRLVAHCLSSLLPQAYARKRP